MNKREKKRPGVSLYTRFLTSFALVLAFPFILVVLLYQTVYTQEENDALRASGALLEQFYYAYNEKLAAVENMARQIAQNTQTGESIRQDAMGGIPSYDIYQLRQYLTSMRSDHLQDMCIYFRNSDIIISPYNSVMSGEAYYKTYFTKDSPDGLGQWQAVLASTGQNRIVRLETGPARPVLALAQTLNADRYKQNNATLICVMSQGVLEDNLRLYAASTQGIVMIFDDEGRLLAGSHPDRAFMAGLFRGEDAGKDNFSAEYAGERYRIRAMPSPRNGLYYVSAVPERIVWEKFSSFRLLSGLGICGTVLASIALAWFFSKQNYKPVTGILESVSALTQRRYSRGSENEFVEDALGGAFRELERISRQLEDGEAVSRRAFLFRLLHGAYPQSQALDAAFAERGLTLISEDFMVLIYCVEGWDHGVFPDIYEGGETPLIETIVVNVVEELCARRHRGYVQYTAKGVFVCLLNLTRDARPEDAARDVRDVAEQSRDFFAQQLGVYCSVAYSGVHGGYGGIQICYREAQRALEFRLVEGERRILPYGSLSGRQFVYSPDFRASALNILVDSLKNGQTGGEALFDRLTALYFGGGAGTPEAMKSFVYDLGALFSETAERLSLPRSAAAPAWGGFTENAVLQTVRRSFAQAFADLARAWEEDCAQRRYSHKIRGFLQENYADANLNVNTVGYHFGLSPAYCSRLFRGETGLSIGDFLLQVRLEKARELLTGGDDSVEEIAARTGFLSSSVFIRLFKKGSGVTPGAYRRMWQKKKDSIG